MLIINGQIYVNHKFQRGVLKIQNGRIRLCREDEKIPAGERVLDAEGKKIVPGFLDIHTHGAIGVDVNGATAEDLERIGIFFTGNGTTSWLASVLTDTQEQTEWCLGQYNAYKSSERKGAQLLGIHLEGPFLSSEYKGAMPEELLKKGDAGLVEHYQRLAEQGIRYMTVSPEVEGVHFMNTTGTVK